MSASVRLSPDAAIRLDGLFREHNAFVVRLAARELGDADGAQDVAQSAWLSVVPLLARGEAMTSPRALLATVVRRRVIDYRRTAAFRRERPADWSDAVTSRSLPPAGPADVDALVLDGLTPRQTLVVAMTARGMSQRSISARTGLSPWAVYSHLHRGASKLRDVTTPRRHGVTTAFSTSKEMS